MEYNYRTGKMHKSSELFPKLMAGIVHIPKGELTPFKNCAARKDMGIDYKNIEDTYEAYKMYLIDRWARDKLVPKWTNRVRPF
jgi:hypothetical protein